MSMLVVVIIGKISQMNSGKFPVLEMNHFMKNPDKIWFRVDPNLKLSGVPTFLKYGDLNQKLVESQLFKEIDRLLIKDDSW